MSPKSEILIGKAFGHLTAIKLAKPHAQPSGRRVAMWDCQCDCGNPTTVRASCLKSGNTKSCGCSAHRTGKHSRRWKGHERISSKYWSQCRRSAFAREIPFKISIHEAWKKFIDQKQQCALTGLSIVFASDTIELQTGAQTASLDRIDSSSGYTLDNTQWVHKDINLMKNHFDEDYFISMCKLITQHRNQ